MYEIFAVIAAILFGLSTAMQKYSMKEIGKFSIRNLIKNKIWIYSLLVTAVAGVLYIVSLRKIELGMSQIIFSSSFLVPVLIGAYVFKEKMGVKRWLAVVSIIIGVILVIF